MKNRNLDHKDHWMTPGSFYDLLDKEHNFNFDPCPYHHDTDKWDGLEVDWKERNFINPPYSQKLKDLFVKKAIFESYKGKLCVLLIPVSTSTKLFHNYILPNIARPIEYVRGRIPFIGINAKGQKVNYPEPIKDLTIEFEGETIPMHVKNSGQHDSMIVIFDGRP